MRLRIDGQRKLAARLRKLRGELDKAAAQALAESAAELRDELRAELAGRDGPSAPGDTPASDSGRLAASLFVESEASGHVVRVGTDLDYGRHLEFGTSRMAARPWLFPTFERLKPRIKARIGDAVRSAIKTAGK